MAAGDQLGAQLEQQREASPHQRRAQLHAGRHARLEDHRATARPPGAPRSKAGGSPAVWVSRCSRTGSVAAPSPAHVQTAGERDMAEGGVDTLTGSG